MKGYKLAGNRIVVSEAFLKKANNIGSEAFTTLKELRALGLPIVEGKVTSKSKSKKDKEGKVSTKIRPIPYEQMEDYINCLDKPDYFLKRLEALKKEAATSRHKGYPFVLRWFRETFPNFNTYEEKYNADHKIISPAIPEAEAPTDNITQMPTSQIELKPTGTD